MRKVGEGQSWVGLRHHEFACVCNPARGGDRGPWSPKLEQGEWAKPLRQLIPQLTWHRVAIGQLATIRLVDRARGGAEIMARRHVVPPEHVGAGESGVTPLAGLPNLLATD